MGRGRPRKEGAMRDSYRLVMDKDMVRRLDNLSRLTGMTKADIFREAFNGYEKLKSFQFKSDDEGSMDDFYDDFDEFPG